MESHSLQQEPAPITEEALHREEAPPVQGDPAAFVPAEPPVMEQPVVPPNAQQTESQQQQQSQQHPVLDSSLQQTDALHATHPAPDPVPEQAPPQQMEPQQVLPQQMEPQTEPQTEPRMEPQMESQIEPQMEPSGPTTTAFNEVAQNAQVPLDAAPEPPQNAQTAPNTQNTENISQNEPMDQHPATEPMAEPMSEPVPDPMADPMEEPMDEPMAEPVAAAEHKEPEQPQPFHDGAESKESLEMAPPDQAEQPEVERADEVGTAMAQQMDHRMEQQMEHRPTDTAVDNVVTDAVVDAVADAVVDAADPTATENVVEKMAVDGDDGEDGDGGDGDGAVSGPTESAVPRNDAPQQLPEPMDTDDAEPAESAMAEHGANANAAPMAGGGGTAEKESTAMDTDHDAVAAVATVAADAVNAAAAAVSSPATNPMEPKPEVVAKEDPQNAVLSELVECQKLLEEFMKRPEAEPFNEPVDWKGLNLPDYPMIIKHQMDMGTVAQKLRDGKYATADKMAKDMHLVFRNAMTYNTPGSGIYVVAENLLKQFERRFARITKVMPYKRRRLGAERVGGEPSTYEQRQMFTTLIQQLTPSELGAVVELIDRKCPQGLHNYNDNEEELDIEVYNIDKLTLSELTGFIEKTINKRSKRRKRKEDY